MTSSVTSPTVLIPHNLQPFNLAILFCRVLLIDRKYLENSGRSISPSSSPGYFSLLYFATAAKYTKKSSDIFPAPLPVKNLFAMLEKEYRGITDSVLSSSAVTINLHYVDMEQNDKESDGGLKIQKGDEVAIIPPVSSG